jgi:prepilin-type N-terminal cleavage/methylation domain-containing protein
MKRQRGSTMMEVLAVLAVMAVGLGISALYLRPVESPLSAGATLVEGVFRQARLNAIATTSAYRVSPSTSQLLIAERGDSCAATTWTADDDTQVLLPEGVTFESDAWTVCFTSRGVSADNQTIRLQHGQYGSIGIEVLLGGTTRVVD